MAAINTKVKKAVIPVAGLGNQDVAGDEGHPERDAATCR